jgi:DNA invertase Pin-like site-specific DNA recombinase
MTQTVPTSFFVRAYLRASSDEQDAQRARSILDKFAREKGVSICNYYAENESGARLDRPELFRLLSDSRPNDILLIEDVDRLSRLTGIDWEKLKKLIREREIRVVAVNVPTTWQHLASQQIEFDARMFCAINDMLLDMLAAIARRDYEQRKQRQAQGIEKAKAAGKYIGRQPNLERYAAIKRLIASGSSWSVVQKTVGCSRSTISKAIRYAETDAKLSQPMMFSVTAILWFYVENGSKFTRGKRRVRESIESIITYSYGGTKLDDTAYRLKFNYNSDESLKEQIDGLLKEIWHVADMRNCVVEDLLIQNEANDLYWDEYDGGWK